MSVRDHRTLADALRRRVLEGAGETDPRLRQAVAAASTDGRAAVPSPYGELARQIGQAAYRTTDEQVEAVLRATQSEKATFELILAAAVGAGLFRWRQGMKAVDEATHATT